MAHVNVGRPRTLRTSATEDAKISAVKRELWKSAGHIARETGLPQVFYDGL
jgi:hypothetical protein